ncbi:urease accessory protein UreE [Acidisoma sp. C75]
MRAVNHLPAGTWNVADAADAVLLDHDHRHRRRFLLKTVSGAECLLDLPQAVALKAGDGLKLEDGRILAVQAMAERVLDIHAHDEDALARIAWHLGNRHLPVQFLPGEIRIRYDHVIAEMVEILGGHGQENMAPFDPESGAYAPGTGGHHHHHDDDDLGHHHHD